MQNSDSRPDGKLDLQVHISQAPSFGFPSLVCKEAARSTFHGFSMACGLLLQALRLLNGSVDTDG